MARCSDKVGPLRHSFDPDERGFVVEEDNLVFLTPRPILR